MSEPVQAALDLSGVEALLAVERAGMVTTAAMPMPRRAAAGLTDWVLSTLQNAGVSLADVGKWTVGAGPGSFTGLRLAAALVEGWSFGRQVLTRCVPGALALSELLDLSEGQKGGILYDGRNQEMLLFGVQKVNGLITAAGETAILNQTQAASYFAGHDLGVCGALIGDLPALSRILPPEQIKKVSGFDHLPIAALLNNAYGPFDNDLTKLVYIRPSVANFAE